MNLAQSLASVYILPKSNISISASSKAICSCRGICKTHIGPCTIKSDSPGEFCASCDKLSEMSAAQIADALTAGGPGSGRHRTGISDLEKQSVMHLRRSGFKTNKSMAVGNTHAMSMTDSTGKTHVMNLSKGGFTHSVSNPGSPMRFKSVGSGTHKQMGNYASTNFARYKGPMAGATHEHKAGEFPSMKQHLRSQGFKNNWHSDKEAQFIKRSTPQGGKVTEHSVIVNKKDGSFSHSLATDTPKNLNGPNDGVDDESNGKGLEDLKKHNFGFTNKTK